MPQIMLLGFEKQEVSACKLMVRAMPGVSVIAVQDSKNTLTEPMGQTTSPKDFSERLAVCAGAEGKVLDVLLGIPTKATTQKVYKAVMTAHNKNWSFEKLFRELKREEAQIEKQLKK